MAQIKSKDDTRILNIEQFLGLNESPDGDTTLKTGEMYEMKNFRITLNKHLQIRPGSKTVFNVADAFESFPEGSDIPDEEDRHADGFWRGAAGQSVWDVAAWAGYFWELDIEHGTATARGTYTGTKGVHFFGFGGKIYALDGVDIYGWDLTNAGFKSVDGYTPLILTSAGLDGAGISVEPLNLLSGLRKVSYSVENVTNASVFHLPEQSVTALVSATAADGTSISFYGTPDLSAGTFSLSLNGTVAALTVDVVYRKGDAHQGSDLRKMRFSELFNGATDTRVFLYGDGSNLTFYSGVPYETGKGSAEYFPAFGEVAIGDENTPITALIRHYSRLIVYKTDSAWSVQYATLTLDDGSLIAAFTALPVNRQLGNDAPGQVKLLENQPLTLDAGAAYRWSSAGYSTFITANENNAKRISDRAQVTLRRFDFQTVRTFNIKSAYEYWFLRDSLALIYNYGNDVWYVYEDIPFQQMIEADDQVYGLADDGRVLHFSRDYRNDDGAEIDCYAETGSMAFDKEWLQKYVPMLFVSMMPESNARIHVTAQSNKRSDYPDRVVAFSLATFEHVDFRHWSFGTNRKPQVKRVRLKVKKAAYYKLVFKSHSASATATVTSTDIKLRYAGQVK